MDYGFTLKENPFRMKYQIEFNKDLNDKLFLTLPVEIDPLVTWYRKKKNEIKNYKKELFFLQKAKKLMNQYILGYINKNININEFKSEFNYNNVMIVIKEEANILNKYNEIIDELIKILSNLNDKDKEKAVAGLDLLSNNPEYSNVYLTKLIENIKELKIK